MASANHDERHFENPGSLDLYRDNSAEHLSFGYGAHQCMGKNIARMEMRIFLEEFLKCLPHMELVPGQVFKYLPNAAFRGPESLWVRWDPSKNPAQSESSLSADRPFKIGAPSRADIVRQMQIAEVRNEAAGVMSLVLEQPNRRPLPAWSPGAHIDVLAGGYERKYSLCGDPSDQTRYKIAVLKNGEGRGGSRYFHENLKIGALVQVRGPKNHFRLQEDAPRYVLIAAGIGITPIVAMADRLKTLGKNYALHYAGRSTSAMAYLDRLKSDHGDRLHLYTKSNGRRMQLNEIAKPMAAGQKVYACGPDRLLSELEELAQHWPENTLHVEHFSPTNSLLDPATEHGFEVELRDSNLTINVPSDRTVLDVLEAAGVDIACDCREGLCGSCEARVIEGEIDHRDRVLSQAERERNNQMMTCCSRARGKKLVLAL
jgi:ferredoxin-NADP reductase